MAKQKQILEACREFLGTPYVWGGESTKEGGMDCSGYAYRVMKMCGLNVYRNTADGYRKGTGTRIDAKDKQPSDLLFFGNNGKATHIGFYAGNGMMYESRGGSKNTKENPGEGVVLSKITRADLMEVRRIADDIFVSDGLDYSILFNPTYYSNRYYDLWKTFGNNSVKLFEHFLKYGMKEGRQPSATFDVAYYKSQYKDLQKAFGDNLSSYYKHYVQYGHKEGRKTVKTYTVQAGPFLAKEDAEKCLAEIKDLGYDVKIC